jgi:hypothetical protein
MIKDNNITIVLGKKGSGKTSYALNRIQAIERLVAFDFNHEYNEGFYIVTDPKKLVETLSLNHATKFRISYQPDANTDLAQHFEYLSRAVFCMTDMTLLAEEIDIVSSASEIPEGLRKIINYGRHRGISIIALSRRAHRIPRDLTANADQIISFNQNEPRDIKYLSDYMGSDNALRVTRLKRTDSAGEFLEWTDTGTDTKEINFVDKSIKLCSNNPDVDPEIKPPSE